MNSNWYKGTIVFDKERNAYGVHDIDVNMRTGNSYPVFITDNSHWEITGNIHDNVLAVTPNEVQK
jgi:hypothetical protein